MTNEFPDLHPTDDYPSLFPKIEEDIASLGIDASSELGSLYGLRIRLVTFKSHDDLNYYKVAGLYEESDWLKFQVEENDE